MKTAIEQLMIALYEGGYLKGNGNEIDDILGKYKKVFKQQIEKTFDDAVESEILWKKITAEQYYKETYGSKGSDDKFDVLKEMFELEQQLDIPSHLKFHNRTSSQTEISDEEIEKAALEYFADYKGGANQWEISAFIMGMKKYREQLKKKQ